MPFVVEREDGVFEEVSGNFQAGRGESAVNHPSDWLEAASAKELEEAGVARVEPQSIPAGKVVRSTSYVRIGGKVVQILDLEDAPAVVPQSVTPRQLRLALLGAGKLEQIEWFLEGPNAPREAIISWEYATEFLRADPMLNQLAAVLQPPLGEEEIDQLFVAAAQIQ